MNDPSRRTFVKRSAATGITLSFAGLIRAHGGGGGDRTTVEATTWDPQGTTYETIYDTTWDPYGATHETTYDTTWDPEETTTTTETTTGYSLVSLEKQIPTNGDGPIFHNPLFHGANVYLRIVNMESDLGLIEISAGPGLIFSAKPQWRVTLFQEVKADQEQSQWVPTDCASCRVRVKVELDLFGDNQIPFNIPPGLEKSLLESIYGVVAPAIAADPKVLALRTGPGVSMAFFDGPSLTAGYNVLAAYGIDHGVPDQVGPLVVVGNRLGRVDTSSHGYWLTLDSQLSPTPPSVSVNFTWSTELRTSGFINIAEHVRVAILNGLNEGPIQQIQAQHPGINIMVFCHIPGLPTGGATISQLVVSIDLPPNANGTDCPLLYPRECEFGTGLAPLHENPPDDNHWDQVDPPNVACPPPPILV
jgi:hypothetical protein